MTRKLRIGVVGAGYFSQFHLQGWSRMAREGLIDIVGIADREVVSAHAMAQRFGVERVCSSARELLQGNRLDLLDIVTPPVAHRELVSTAIERGVAAICQKPFGVDYVEAAALAQSAVRTRVALVIHENVRFSPWYREMRRLIDDGALGRLHGIAFRLRPGDGQGVRAYLDRQPYFQTMPRLLVVETAIHWIDTFRYLLGDVAAVYARLRRINPEIAGEDAGIIMFEFACGAAGLFDGNRCNDHVAANPRRTMGECWIEGHKGVLRLDGDARLYFKPHRGDEREHPYERGPDDSFGGGACERLQRHVVAHLTQAAPLENSATAYLTNLRIQEAVYRSHAEGRRIEIARFDPLERPADAPFAALANTSSIQ